MGKKNRNSKTNMDRLARKNKEREDKRRAMKEKTSQSKIVVKSTATMVEGMFADYVRLSSAVASLKSFAKMRFDQMSKMAENDPTKFADMRIESYKEFQDSLSFIDDTMSTLASFLGECDDAPSNREKMEVVSRNLPRLFEAQEAFETKSRELQELDKRFITKLNASNLPDMDSPKKENVEEVEVKETEEVESVNSEEVKTEENQEIHNEEQP